MAQKAWLRVRNLTARCLVMAGRVPAGGDAQSVSPHPTDGVNNGETTARCPAIDIVKRLVDEWRTTLSDLSFMYANRTTNQVNCEL